MMAIDVIFCDETHSGANKIVDGVYYMTGKQYAELRAGRRVQFAKGPAPIVNLSKDDWAVIEERIIPSGDI